MYESDIDVHSFQIGDEVIEIVYAEQRDQTERVRTTRLLSFDRSIAGVEVAEILDALRELVDTVLTRSRERTSIPPSRSRFG